MKGTVKLDLSGIELELEGLPASFVTKLTDDWAPFVTGEVREPVLRVEVELREPTAASSPFAPQSLNSKVRGREGEFSLPGGRAVLGPAGEVRVQLHSASRESHFNLVNLVLACLAVRLPARGAMLLHAACLVVEGRAYLLVGTSGTGKSTWTRLGLDAGAQAIGDDLVLVEAQCVLGSPFRSRHLDGRAERGRWPIAAIFFPHHGNAASRSPAQRLIAQARVMANLPFISAATRRDVATEGLVDSLLDHVPCFDLTFARDSAFMEFLNGGRDD
jgi:hypothetical protein